MFLKVPKLPFDESPSFTCGNAETFRPRGRVIQMVEINFKINKFTWQIIRLTVFCSWNIFGGVWGWNPNFQIQQLNSWTAKWNHCKMLYLLNPLPDGRKKLFLVLYFILAYLLILQCRYHRMISKVCPVNNNVEK